MESNNNISLQKKNKGIILAIISIIFTTIAIFCVIMFGCLIYKHFELQKTATDWEGLGSLGLILAGIIYAIGSVFCVVISTIFSIINLFKANNLFKKIAIIIIIINFLIIVSVVVEFLILRFTPIN